MPPLTLESLDLGHIGSARLSIACYVPICLVELHNLVCLLPEFDRGR